MTLKINVAGSNPGDLLDMVRTLMGVKFVRSIGEVSDGGRLIVLIVNLTPQGMEHANAIESLLTYLAGRN